MIEHIKTGDCVRITRDHGQLSMQNTRGYVTAVNGHILAVRIHEPARPSVDGLTAYVSRDNTVKL